MAHYPAGASKYNPIERRVFSQISKNWAAEPLTDYAKILGLIRKTTTTTGCGRPLTSTPGGGE